MMELLQDPLELVIHASFDGGFRPDQGIGASSAYILAVFRHDRAIVRSERLVDGGILHGRSDSYAN